MKLSVGLQNFWQYSNQKEREISLTWGILREKWLYSELFWPAFSRIWTEYREILRISPYQSKYGKMRTRITPNPDTFYEIVYVTIFTKIVPSQMFDRVLTLNLICKRPRYLLKIGNYVVKAFIKQTSYKLQAPKFT